MFAEPFDIHTAFNNIFERLFKDIADAGLHIGAGHHIAVLGNGNHTLDGNTAKIKTVGRGQMSENIIFISQIGNIFHIISGDQGIEIAFPGTHGFCVCDKSSDSFAFCKFEIFDKLITAYPLMGDNGGKDNIQSGIKSGINGPQGPGVRTGGIAEFVVFCRIEAVKTQLDLVYADSFEVFCPFSIKEPAVCVTCNIEFLRVDRFDKLVEIFENQRFSAGDNDIGKSQLISLTGKFSTLQPKR